MQHTVDFLGENNYLDPELCDATKYMVIVLRNAA
jgi:hypothetical protein